MVKKVYIPTLDDEKTVASNDEIANHYFDEKNEIGKIEEQAKEVLKKDRILRANRSFEKNYFNISPIPFYVGFLDEVDDKYDTLEDRREKLYKIIKQFHCSDFEDMTPDSRIFLWNAVRVYMRLSVSDFPIPEKFQNISNKEKREKNRIMLFDRMSLVVVLFAIFFVVGFIFGNIHGHHQKEYNSLTSATADGSLSSIPKVEQRYIPQEQPSKLHQIPSVQRQQLQSKLTAKP